MEIAPLYLLKRDGQLCLGYILDRTTLNCIWNLKNYKDKLFSITFINT